MRPPPIVTKTPGEGVPRTWSSPELKLGAEALQALRASIQALEQSNGSNDTASALAHAAKSLSKLQRAAGALASYDPDLSEENTK